MTDDAAAGARGTLRRRGGVTLVGDGAGDAGQSDHRLHPDRAPRGDSRSRTVECVHRRQPTTESDRGPGTRGDVHGDFRSGAGARGTRRQRRRGGLRPATGDAGNHPAPGGDPAGGDRRAASRASHAGCRSEGQCTAHDGVRLSAAATGDLLRTVFGVHGNPEHPQRVRPASLGAGRQQRDRDRHPRPLPDGAGRAFSGPGADGQREAVGARHRNDVGGVHPGRHPAGRHPLRADQPAAAVGNRRATQAVRNDGRRHGALRADQPGRADYRQPDRQHRGRVRAGDLQLRLVGVATALRHHRSDHSDGRHAATQPQRCCRRRPGRDRRPVAGHPADHGDTASGGGVHDHQRTRDRQRPLRLRQIRGGRCQLSRHRDRAVRLHADPLRAGAAATSGVLRPRRTLDADPDHHRDNDREDRGLPSGPAPDRQPRTGGRLSRRGQRTRISRGRRARSPIAAAVAAPTERPTVRSLGHPHRRGHRGGRTAGRARRHRSRPAAGVVGTDRPRRWRIHDPAGDRRLDHAADPGGGHAQRPGARRPCRSRSGPASASPTPAVRRLVTASELSPAPKGYSRHVL